MPEKFQRNRWSRSRYLKVVKNSALKLFWNSKHNCSEVERATSSNFPDKTNFSVAYSYLTAKAV